MAKVIFRNGRPVLMATPGLIARIQGQKLSLRDLLYHWNKAVYHNNRIRSTYESSIEESKGVIIEGLKKVAPRNKTSSVEILIQGKVDLALNIPAYYEFDSFITSIKRAVSKLVIFSIRINKNKKPDKFKLHVFMEALQNGKTEGYFGSVNNPNLRRLFINNWEGWIRDLNVTRTVLEHLEGGHIKTLPIRARWSSVQQMSESPTFDEINVNYKGKRIPEAADEILDAFNSLVTRVLIELETQHPEAKPNPESAQSSKPASP